MYDSADMQVSINPHTGRVDVLRAGGVDFVRPGAFRLCVVADNEDPWGSTVRSYPEVVGEFSLVGETRAAAYAGSNLAAVEPIRIIEEGPVRTVIEAILEFRDSACVVRYAVPASGRYIDVAVDVDWRETNRMLKLGIAAPFENSALFGQVAFGREKFRPTDDEVVTQRWQAIVDEAADTAIAVIDDGVYGSDFHDGELRISLLHSPVYSALQLGDRPLVTGDRVHPRIDHGERHFRFRVVFGGAAEVLSRIDADAQCFAEPPYLLSIFSGGGSRVLPRGLEISRPEVLCSALKRAEIGDGYIMRLFNSADRPVNGHATIEAAHLRVDFDLGPFEVSTYRFDSQGTWTKTNMIER